MILVSQEQIKEYTANGWWGTETIDNLFQRNAKAAPNELALIDPPNRSEIAPGAPQRLTYAEVAQQADRLAAALLNLGAGKDDVIMVQLPNIIELPIVYLAAARIGSIVSPLPMQYRAHELRQTMNVVEPKVFITTQTFMNFNFVEMVQGVQAEISSLKAILAVTLAVMIPLILLILLAAYLMVAYVTTSTVPAPVPGMV